MVASVILQCKSTGLDFTPLEDVVPRLNALLRTYASEGGAEAPLDLAMHEVRRGTSGRDRSGDARHVRPRDLLLRLGPQATEVAERLGAMHVLGVELIATEVRGPVSAAWPLLRPARLTARGSHSAARCCV